METIGLPFCTDCDNETAINKDGRCVMCGGGRTYRRVVRTIKVGHSEDGSHRIRNLNERLGHVAPRIQPSTASQD